MTFAAVLGSCGGRVRRLLDRRARERAAASHAPRQRHPPARRARPPPRRAAPARDLAERIDAAGGPLGLRAADVGATRAGAALVAPLMALPLAIAMPSKLRLIVLVTPRRPAGSRPTCGCGGVRAVALG